LGRGFLAGISWGALVGALTIALASQLTERRTLVPATPQTAAVEVPGGSEFNRPPPETEPVLPEPDAPPAAAAPATVAAPEPVAAPSAAPETAPAPEVAAVAPAPAPGAAAPETAGVPGTAPAPAAAPQPAPAAPEAPAADTALAALPERSPVTPPAEIAQPAAPTADAAEPAPAAADAAPAGAGPAPAPSAPAAPPAAVAADVTPPAPPAVPEAAIALSPPADAAPAAPAAPSPARPPADARPATVPEAPATPLAEPRVADAPAAPAPPAGGAMAPAGTGIPTPGFAGAEGVRVNRLPTIGGATPADPPAEAAAAPEEPAPDPDAPALVRFAVPFENPDLRPVVALVLLHARPVLPGADTGLDLPLPVSFAVDAGLVEAGTVADAYRAAGREVLLVPTLPPGAAAADVEVALQVNFDVIPEAVALMDLPEGGFQSEREAVAQVVASIAATGHGLVTFPRGLNMAEQMASRAGVPTRAVFRVLEAGNTDAVLRILDQAAFRARQEGTVILVGEAEPATVAAIRRWTEANPDADILFAPISAALAAGE
jgi:polysaccharide deacetylase 2 family uncharacterized protein YibQ